jgi:signal transduction histidine kinase
LLVGILLAFSIAVVIIRLSIDRQLTRSSPPTAVMFLDRLEAEVRAVPPGERAAQLERLRAESGGPVEILALDDPTLPETVRAGHSAMPLSGDGITIYLPLPEGGVLVVGPQANMIRPTTGDFALILATWIGLVALFGTLMAMPAVRRFERLERVTAAFGAGDLDVRAPELHQGPTDQLARSFNVMADRVQALLRAQQQLVQAVAHEVHTPIARLRFGMEMLAMTEDPEQRLVRQHDLEGDLAEMEALVEELLVFSRYETGRGRTTRQRVPVRATVERQVDRLGPPRRGITIVIEPEAGAPAELVADARAFNRVVGNLLSNAVRFARNQVTVSWSARDGGVEFTVADDGPGIPAADRQRVFDPFTRLDLARDRASGGAGLGLAIVKRIVEAHEGQVRVEETPGGGAQLVCHWPQAGDPPSVAIDGV